MKNKKSPLHWTSAMGGYGMGTGTFGSVMGSNPAAYNLLTGAGRRIQNPQNWVDPYRGPDVIGAGGGSVTGIGAKAQSLTDASTQFDDGTVQAMEGIFGNTSARQTSVGGSGMMVLEKHLSPVNNNEEEPLYSEEDWHKVASVNDRYAVDLGIVKSKKPDLTAYKPPNPPYDPTSGDDGAGGREYDINK